MCILLIYMKKKNHINFRYFNNEHSSTLAFCIKVF